MEEKLAKKEVANTGRELLELGLVARTWGNISCRIDAEHIAISPSGLGYENMTDSDVPVLNINTKESTGKRNPSSEKLIHISAAKIFKEENYFVHTHQTFATAVGLVGTKDLAMTEEERELLGKVMVAEYGAPGTQLLNDNVEKTLLEGSKVVLMKHHGVLICGKDRKDAINKALVLEKVCKRAVEIALKMDVDYFEILSKEKYDNAMDDKDMDKKQALFRAFTSYPIIETSKLGGFNTQVDDMAQMIGEKIDAVEFSYENLEKAFFESDAVLMNGKGCIVVAITEDDLDAMEILLTKAAICKLYTLKCGVNADLDVEDCLAMRKFYVESYSKRKG